MDKIYMVWSSNCGLGGRHWEETGFKNIDDCYALVKSLNKNYADTNNEKYSDNYPYQVFTVNVN